MSSSFRNAGRGSQLPVVGLLLILLCFVVVQNTGASHDYPEDQEYVRELRNSGEILSLSSIIDDASKRYQGRLLEVELEREDGVLIYELEMLMQDGTVIELFYDARTGELIGVEPGD